MPSKIPSMAKKLRHVLSPGMLLVVALSVASITTEKRGSFSTAILTEGLPAAVTVVFIHLSFYGNHYLCRAIGSALSRTAVSRLPLSLLYMVAGLPLAILGAIGVCSLARTLGLDPKQPLSLRLYVDAALSGLFGFALASILTLIIPPGIGSVLQELLKRRRIVTIRKFFNDTTKLALEHILPVAINHFGEFTIIEAPDEYRRDEEPSWSEPQVLRNPINLLVVPLPDHWLPDFFELWLGRTNHLRFLPDTWRQNVREELWDAHSVIVDVTQFSEHVVWEIEQMKTSSRGVRLIPISIGTDARTAIRRYRRALASKGLTLTEEPIQFVVRHPITHDSLIKSNSSAISKLMARLAAAEPPVLKSDLILVSVVWLAFMFSISAVDFLRSSSWSTEFGLCGFFLMFGASAFGRVRQVCFEHQPLASAPTPILGKPKDDLEQSATPSS